MTERPQPDFFSQTRKWVSEAMTKPEIPTKPTVLVVQARVNPLRISQEQERLMQLAERVDVQLSFVNPLTEPDHPWEKPEQLLYGVSGVIFPGSGDVDLTVDTPERTKYMEHTAPLADEALRRGTDPDDFLNVFGICLGDQWLHMRAQGQVERNPDHEETGTGTVTLTKAAKNDSLLRRIPREVREDGQEYLRLILGHKDSKKIPGAGFTVLGSTERDPYSMTRNGRVFTTAGHPEIIDGSQLKTIVNVSNDHSHLETGLAPYVPTYPFEDTPDADQMLSAFFEIAIETHNQVFKTTN